MRKSPKRKIKEIYSPEMDIAWESLSERELQCLYWAMRGYQNDQIGEKLFIEGITVERHIGAIYQKTGIAFVEGSPIRKLFWFFTRDNLIEHLYENGKLSDEYLASRSKTRSLLLEYKKQNKILERENYQLKQELNKHLDKIERNDTSTLNDEELEIAKLVISGISDKKIAKKLGKKEFRVAYVNKIIRVKLGMDGSERITRAKYIAKLNEINLNNKYVSFESLDPKIREELTELVKRLD